jgi:tetratricopeptide repeat protein 21B
VQTKYSAAQELCKKCLEVDRSSAQAWDVLGLSMEKELDYQHAADCFLKAWKLEFEASAPIGFKLAFCYLKTHMYTEAIDICEKVLSLYPDYPRIKEEILKKAINSIRGA